MSSKKSEPVEQGNFRNNPNCIYTANSPADGNEADFGDNTPKRMLQRLQQEQIRLITLSVLIIAMGVLAFLFYQARSVLIPFVLAIFFSMLVSPIQKFFTVKRRYPSWIGFIASLVVVGLMITFFASILIISVQSTIRGATEYSQQFIDSIDKISAPLNDWGIEANFETIKKYIKDSVQDIGPQVFSIFRSLLGTLTLLAIFLFFILWGRNFKNQEKGGIFALVEEQTRKYIFIKTIISLITGIFAWAVLRYLNCPMAEMIGVATFVLNYIPSIGSIIATFLPIPLVMAQGGGTVQVVWVIVLLGIVQNLMGNLIEPKIQGKGLSLHPVAILMSLAIWGLLWGPIGMLLAAPIAAAMKAGLEQFETTRPFARIMGGDSFDDAFADDINPHDDFTTDDVK